MAVSNIVVASAPPQKISFVFVGVLGLYALVIGARIEIVPS
jgi:hypothetical protein